MATKKTLYEILDVPAGADRQAILEAYRRKGEALQAEGARLDREEFVYRQNILNSAFDVLNDPVTRRAYDARLASEGGRVGTELSRHAMPRRADSDVVGQRADILSLRADALALRADALAIKGDIESDYEPPARSWLPRILGDGNSPVRRALVIVVTVIAILAVLQLTTFLFVARKQGDIASQAAKAEEQVVIQEYYQKYGVRPASAAEARLLERESERREREEREAQRAREREEEKARRFQEEARKLGDKVSQDMQIAEERIRREEERKRERQEEEERRRQAAEEERLMREQQKWRAVLSR